MKRISNAARNVIDVVEYETAAKLLLDPENELLFVNIYDAISDTVMNGTPLTPDQKKILMLPFQVWGSRAGLELHNIRKKRWAARPDPLERRRESIRSRFTVTGS